MHDDYGVKCKQSISTVIGLCRMEMTDIWEVGDCLVQP